MPKAYAIIGGGISGLTVAYRLKKHDPAAHIRLFEQSSRTGGWIDTRSIDGFLLEMGPRSLRPQGKGAFTLQLIEELGLQEDVIEANASARVRYLYENKQLRALPHSLTSFIFSPLFPLCLKAAWQDWRAIPGEKPDESVHHFVERHFGANLAERLADPLTLGIYAASSRDLSLQACFPEWAELDREHGSLLKGMFAKKSSAGYPRSHWIAAKQKGPIFSFKNGMRTLVEALHQKIEDSLYLNAEVQHLQFQPEGIEVIQKDGSSFFADHVFSTVPLQQLKTFAHIPVPELPLSSVAVAAIGFDKQLLKHKGFGYLIPSKEQENILGMVWDSCTFPQQNQHSDQTRLTVMMAGGSSRDFKTIALEALARHLHIEEKPDALEIKEAINAIPLFPIGYRQWLGDMQEIYQKKHLTLLGPAFNGVAVNDCIASAFSIRMAGK
jgi:oxygen-dependent protoporphyrinogen oxidase